MTALRLLLAGLLGALGLVFLTPAVSHACSCVGGTVADFTEWSDAVFTGTLVDVAQPPELPIMSSGDPVTYTFEVDAVHEGDAAATTDVQSAVSGSSCGIEGLEVGRRYVVFARAGKDGLSANSCGGTAPARAGLLRKVDRVLGAGEPPRPGSTEADTSQSGGPAVWVLVGAAGLLAVGTSVLVLRRRP